MNRTEGVNEGENLRVLRVWKGRSHENFGKGEKRKRNGKRWPGM